MGFVFLSGSAIRASSSTLCFYVNQGWQSETVILNPESAVFFTSESAILVQILIKNLKSRIHQFYCESEYDRYLESRIRVFSSRNSESRIRRFFWRIAIPDVNLTVLV